MSRYGFDLFRMYPFYKNLDDLVSKKLLRIKEYSNGYRVLKYTTKAFFNAEWDEVLVNCRGTVIDENNNIVLYPFTKTFNYGEKGINGIPTLINENNPVIAIEKINGFMASFTKLPNGSFLYGSTGTLDSDYVMMAKETIEKQVKSKYLDDIPFGFTCIFEICHKEDPHIVDEKEGAYLLGMRSNHLNSNLVSESVLDSMAKKAGFYRPTFKSYSSFSKAKEEAQKSNREGAMIRSAYEGNHLCKIKSKHYLTKKFLMRGKSQKIWNTNTIIDEDYKDIVEKIKKDYTEDNWSKLDELKKKEIFEYYVT